ncbi:MAG: alpha-ketoglutarate-dependent dioxygenase AlkB [Chlamydiota bacterium]
MILNFLNTQVSSNVLKCCSQTRLISGLYIYPDFLPPEDQKNLQEKVINLHTYIVNESKNSNSQRCQTFLSRYHNLSSDEHYRQIQLNDAQGNKVTCQHFEKYGESGHKLSYFIGNDNLPTFLQSSLLSRILQIPEVITITEDSQLNWNFTFNTYATTKTQPTKLAGFAFHKDIDSNGEVTMIYSLGASSTFHIRHPKKISDTLSVPLLPNSLLLLSKEARWDYEHCVVPVDVDKSSSLIETQLETIKRVSLVLGFTRIFEKTDRYKTEC